MKAGFSRCRTLRSQLGLIQRCLNALTGEVRWRSIENDPDGLAGISKLQVASIPGQQHPTIFAWGQGPSSESIVAFDSSSGEALWNISASSIPGNWQFTGLAAINLDADTLAGAILTCTNSRLRLFDIADQSLIWTSVEMDSYCVDVMPMTTGGSKQLVAVLGQMLRAYDAQTHLLSWSLPNAQGERQTRGASFLPQGVAGAEIAVFSEYAVTFFDAETRVSLRRYELGDYYKPINALAQPQGGSIHDLVITIGDRMHILNGATGELRATSAALGFDAGLFNQLAMHTNSDASYLIGVGTDVAVLTYQVNALTDTIFANGFEN